MDVKVIMEGSADDKQVISTNGVFFIEQVNARAIVDQKSFCVASGNRIKALVPALEPTCQSQSPINDFNRLVSCYKACLSTAVSSGAKTVRVSPLGVGVKLSTILDNGDVIQNGVWGNLFWTQAKTSLAARQAVVESQHDGVTVIFVVPEESFDDWDHAMDF